ncbi:zinc finger protein 286A [Zeugodacus cucurbitae]|uniref:Zinc finger protein 552 n=1 Tax=Zeugodacus cucurbitae TaxID=28588 RepID=A0A0A1WSL9_ZEUCU|nr:zinc finger protein 286A [Zeugodacus cucurbitae]
MPVMEISIKWNICRICLAEEGQNHGAKYILIDSKIVKQIYDITRVQMETSDNLPDKICRKCLLLLKYAYHFRTTCRNSEEYLQSVIQKTKSATSMLKMDKQRERSVELLEEIFHEDVEFISLNDHRDPVVEEYFDTKEENVPSPLTLPEKIGDSRDSTKTNVTNTIPSTSIVLKKQEYHENDRVTQNMSYETNNHDKIMLDNNIDTNTSERDISKTHKEPTSNQKFVDQDDEEVEMDVIYNNRKTNYKQRHFQRSNRKLSKTQIDSNCSEQVLTDQNYEGKELADVDASKTNSKQNPLRLHKYNTEGSVDAFDYADDNKITDEDINDDNNEYNSNNETKEDEIDNDVVDTEIRLDKLKTNNSSPAHEPEIKVQTEDEELYYLIEDPATKTEESSNSQIEDIELEADADDSIQLIDNYAEAEADGSVEDEEPEYEDSETQKSVVHVEEYLIDEIDNESVPQHEMELNEDQLTKRPSSTTIKIRDRASPHMRRKGNDSYIYSCDVCGNHFTSRSLRNYHMRIHRKERNFECELCFKRFTAACNLTAHMRIHTGEKPYECKYCLRRFTDRSTHVKHERVHTNEKPFQCNICGKSFALSTTLRTHEKVHTNEKPFKCEPCEKSFKLPHQLKSHQLTNQHKNIVTALGLENYN